MKSLTNTLRFIVFIGALMTGIIGGATVGRVTGVAGAFTQPVIQRHETALAKSAAWRISPAKSGRPAVQNSNGLQPNPPPEGINNGQRNLLVAWVDHLDSASPRLEGLWLVLFVPDSPSLTWLPLYPSGLIESIDGDQNWFTDFHLTQDDKLDPQFVSDLRSKDVWWNNFLVIDDPGMVVIVNRNLDASEDPAITPQPDAGERIIANMPLAWEDPAAALKAQFELLDRFCLSPATSYHATSAIDLIGPLDHHLITNLKADEILLIWNNLRLTGGRLCKFPTRNPPENSYPQP
jgi:hypothetical protein